MSFWKLTDHVFTQDAQWPEHWHCSCGAQVGGYDYEGAKRDHLRRVVIEAAINKAADDLLAELKAAP